MEVLTETEDENEPSVETAPAAPTAAPPKNPWKKMAPPVAYSDSEATPSSTAPTPIERPNPWKANKTQPVASQSEASTSEPEMPQKQPQPEKKEPTKPIEEPQKAQEPQEPQEQQPQKQQKPHEQPKKAWSKNQVPAAVTSEPAKGIKFEVNDKQMLIIIQPRWNQPKKKHHQFGMDARL